MKEGKFPTVYMLDRISLLKHLFLALNGPALRLLCFLKSLS